MRNRVRLALLALLGAFASVALTVSPVGANDAACLLPTSSYSDAILNPPRGEDTDFFVTTGGVPNVAFLIDTSASMLRLPPDGASSGWGSFEDPLAGGGGAGFGCSNPYGNARTFGSTCGTTTLEGSQYSGAIDFAQAKDADGQYCPYMDQAGKPMKTDKPGYDPDFYPTFFARDRVYHDTVYSPTNARDGWNDSGTSPHAAASVATFCNQASLTAAQRASCATCMSTEGYWFDGSYYANVGRSCSSTAECQATRAGTCIKDSNLTEYNGANDNSAHCRIPNVWFSGNFLNFYPPKFIIARKVVKDVLASVKLFRLGLYTFNNTGTGAAEVSGLNPPCNQVGSPSSFFNNRNSVRNAINNPAKVGFSGGTPLAESLLDLGHLYATQSLPWFAGTPYDRAAFEEKAANNRSVCFACQKSSVILVSDGIPSQDDAVPGVAGWVPMTKAVADTPGKYAGVAGYNITSVSCPTCATASEEPDLTIPAGTCTGQQASGACSGTNNAIWSYLPRVAWYLHNMDSRDDNETGVDGYKMKDKQSLDVYTIGLGTAGNASAILRHSAEAGGGLYNGGMDTDSVASGKELRDAIERSLEEVNTRSVSFGSASLSTLQAAASQSVLVPRFEPSQKALWNGHLYAFDLWSEFTGGCTVPTSGASGPSNGDFDCDGKCTSVFLREKGTVAGGVYSPGAFITEDASGAFVRNSPANRAACGSGNRCLADCATPSTTPATPFWDAGDKLAPVDTTGADKAGGYTAWQQRKIYTVIDDKLPAGRLDGSDSMVQLADDDATVTRLLPYLNLRGNRPFCTRIADTLTSAKNPLGNTVRTQIAANDYLGCAKVVVQYVMGADVFNERACAGYPGSYCTRPYQLGDIFHSSPVEVWPPLPSDGLLCTRGLHPQCLPSLFSSSIPSPSASGHSNAYDDYAKHARYKHRNKFALVGANDGMVHAVLTGTWRPNADDPRTPQKEDRPPFEGYHDVGTGEEIWAFIPPDQLAKMPLLMGSTHHYFVDGTAMVRDVWIDGGTANGTGLPVALDGKRTGAEFHTVAVMGERRGGNKYFALDVTDAGNDLAARPRFMWIYPQPTDAEHLSFGETYTDFVPTPPPIGPVRIDAGPGPCATGASFVDSANATRCFEERWIVFLSGGFDPQFTKGRGVHMVELGSGRELFDFSQPPGTGAACTNASDPRCHLNYPVAAVVGMMMWGKEANFLSAAAVDGYFDTATFGDTGGQLWVLRFSDPGRLDPATGKVTNWYGARVFQAGKTAATPQCGLDFCGAQPFFHITANLPLAANGLYRVLAGTGDRFNLLDPAGGQCSPDNLRACIAKGCTVTLENGVTGGAGASYSNPALGTHEYHATLPASCGALDASKWWRSETASAGSACAKSISRVDELKIVCPAALVCAQSPPVTGEETSKQLVVECTDGTCTSRQLSSGGPIDMKFLADRKNWFYSVQVFEKVGARQIFKTAAEALAYDQARLTETDLTSINEHDASPVKPLASAEGRGWKYYFDHGEPTLPDTVQIGGVGHHIYRTDERVASSTAVEAGCTFFNTLQVALPNDAIQATNECPANSPCKAGKKQLTYLYGLKPGTGGICLLSNETDSLVRSQRTEALVPPHIGKLVAYVASGQVSYGLTSVRTGQGGSNISLGEAQDLSSLMHWLPLDEQTEKCRHAPKDAPPADCR